MTMQVEKEFFHFLSEKQRDQTRLNFLLHIVYIQGELKKRNFIASGKWKVKTKSQLQVHSPTYISEKLKTTKVDYRLAQAG